MKKKLLIVAGAIALALFLVCATIVYVVLHRTEGQYFDSAGVKIHYTDEGSGVPVILVHGYTANADINWRLPGIHSKLRKHFRVIAMDVRGHGLSGKPHFPALYGIETVNDVVRLMDHLKIEKAHLVGYSMGGFITLKFLSKYPDRLLSAMPCGAAWMKPGDPMCKLLLNIHQNITRQHRLVRMISSRDNDLAALNFLAVAFPLIAVREADLRDVKVPVMAVKGGEEEVVVGGSDLKGVLPNFQEVIIPGGNHQSVVLYRQFQESIERFLLEHSPQQS